MLPILRKDEWQIIAIVVALKIVTLVFGIHSFNALEPTAPSGLGLAVWNRWDSPAYLKIAEHGYTATGGDRVWLALFPLFPWCVRAVAVLARDYLVSALIVSGVAAVVAALLLYRLTRLDASRAVAMRTVWMLLIFPSAFFLHIGYTESLFLALTLASVYAARSDRWFISGLAGALAAMSRINGLILIPTLAVEAIQQFVGGRRWQRRWLWSLMPIAGLAVYLLLNHRVTGDPLAFMRFQREQWFTTFAWPWNGMRSAFAVIEFGNNNEVAVRGVEQSLFIVLGLMCTVAAWLAMRASYATWMTLNWLLLTSLSFVKCAPRYTLVMFPIYILLARVSGNRIWASIITTWCLFSGALFIGLFVRGWWVS